MSDHEQAKHGETPCGALRPPEAEGMGQCVCRKPRDHDGAHYDHTSMVEWSSAPQVVKTPLPRYVPRDKT